MRHAVRALVAVSLLVGFYLFALAVVAGLAWAAYAVTRAGVSGYLLGKLWIFVVVIAVLVGKALFGRREKVKADPPGLLLSRQEEPALWSEVESIAQFAGTRAPDEIRLVPEVNAAVSEDSTWLGLVGGTRRLYLGVPLVQGLTRDQLRSVLAHELGHYSGKHTALGAVSYRGQEAISRVIQGLGPDSWTAQLFKLYARLYYAVSHSVNRRQELEADELSADLVGSDTATSALREIEPLDAAWRFYLSAYVDLAGEVGHRPTDLYAGFAQFLASPVRQQQLTETRESAPEPERSVYDSHPATSARVARIDALARPSAPDTSGPAVALLAPRSLDRAQEVLWDGDQRPAAPLSTIVRLAGAETVRHNAQVVRAQLHALDRTPDLAGALALFGAGRAADLLRPLSPDAEDESLRDQAGRLVGDLAAHELVASGRAGHRLDYDGPWRLADSDDAPVDPWPAAVAAARDGDAAAGFEAWLREHDVPLHASEDVAVTMPAPEAPSDDEVLAACSPVGGRYRTVVVLGQGVALRRVSGADRLSLGRAAIWGSASDALLRNALKDGVEGLLRHPRTTLLRWEEITAATYSAKRLDRGRLGLTSADGTQTVKFQLETHKVGDPVSVIEHMLQGRLSRA